ncbi:pullulanase-type alpha-1,6-glucosidase [Aestuariimicrobium ganziense]|uniref:pullulanase-type alpha-1,6-glucosidase n=1 Tax=Aestuariimicrobium ganziense TaxID=2773677 RepID=UPI001943879E|nr:pullulanase-type alpha-1,6-glucosidase [Aestuariimicrobium ganziense]
MTESSAAAPEARAIWVRPDLMLWPGITDDATWSLWSAPDGGIAPNGLNATLAALVPDGPVPDDIAAAHPHLAGHHVLKVPRLDVETLLRGQLLVVATAADGTQARTGVQTALLLDHLYAAEATSRRYGYLPESGEFRVWAPTAHTVALVTWRDGVEQVVGMDAEPGGSWATTVGDADGLEYCFDVTVYVPAVDRVLTNRVTDPCSVALTAGSRHSVAIDLADPRWAPEAWTDTPAPDVERFVDEVIYELHIRDFSRDDDLVPAPLRGSYLAFTADGHGSRHLRRLAEAGLTTVHLLPTFDLGSIPDDRSAWLSADPELLAAAAPDSDAQQDLIAGVRHFDGFNWGYDPWHWTTPEGSYAIDQHGGARIVEFRSMVGALHQMGLRVVMDVVYNHTHASGQDEQSVLDRIVPGYYHRRDVLGGICHSTAANNVATEHAMAEHLIVASMTTLARDHRIDGFRIDLMGHHPKSGMVKVREALDEVGREQSRRVTLYGEGWNFGEVADGARFVQATQANLGGTRIATFNDRIRDGVRGGRPFDADPRHPGFATAAGPCRGIDQDLVMLGLAGNLVDFTFQRTEGGTVTGAELRYGEDPLVHPDSISSPAGYASEPDEVVNYVDAHDNETLFDAMVLKLPRHVSMDARVRLNTIALATVTLSQTAVLWHAGADLLRSKSLDRNSFDSGDHFNRLDWTGADNGFGRGLPPAWDNLAHWPLMAVLLANPEYKPTAEHVALATAMAQDLLRMRAGSRLFRLGSAGLIRQKLSFPVSGTDIDYPGVICMLVDDLAGERVDAEVSGLVVVINATGTTVVQRVPGLAGQWQLHPVQQESADSVVRTAWVEPGDAVGFHVPGFTAAVFVRR